MSPATSPPPTLPPLPTAALGDGDAWTSVGEVRDGVVQGLPYAGRDTYQIEVSGAGELVLPDV